MWKVYRFDRSHGSWRPSRPVYVTANAGLARERFARELAAARRGHVFLTYYGRLVRHVQARRFGLVK
jgi:hypothetical protein